MGGVRFRLVKSREAVILLSWREKVSTWIGLGFPSLPSPSVPQVGIKTQPSDGGMEGWRDGGIETPESPAGALIHRGFSHQPRESGAPQLEEGLSSLKPQRCQKLIAAALLFNYQFSVEPRRSLERA